MFDRIMCVLVKIMVRGHLVMSIIQFINLISVHFWTYLMNLVNHDKVKDIGKKIKKKMYFSSMYL